MLTPVHTTSRAALNWRPEDLKCLKIADLVVAYLNLHQFATPSSTCHQRCTHTPLNKGLSLEISTLVLAAFNPPPQPLDKALPLVVMKVVLSYLEGSLLPLITESSRLSTLENGKLWLPFVGNLSLLPLWKRAYTGDLLLYSPSTLLFNHTRLLEMQNDNLRLFDCRLVCFKQVLYGMQTTEWVHEVDLSTQATTHTPYTMRGRRNPLFFAALEVACSGTRFFAYEKTKFVAVHSPQKRTYQRVTTPDNVHALHFNESTHTLWASISFRLYFMRFSDGVLQEPVPTSIVHAKTTFLFQWTSVLIVGSRGNVTFWDSNTHKQLGSYGYNPGYGSYFPHPFHVEPASGTLFVPTPMSIRVYDLHRLQERAPLHNPCNLSQFAFVTTCGNLLVSAHTNNTIRLWNLLTQAPFAVFSTPYLVKTAAIFYNHLYLLFQLPQQGEKKPSLELWKWTRPLEFA